MCDERERLIEYVYDECDAAERERVVRHLETCGGCREEIAALRDTRQDLLAWQVPDHGSVWTPFAPARLRPWWREVPAWATAAAAGVMLMLGVAGGAASQVLLARPAAPAAPVEHTAAVAPVVPPPAPAAVEGAVSRAEFDALEQRLQTAIRDEEARLARRPPAPGATPAGLVYRTDTVDNVTLYKALYADLIRLQRSLSELKKSDETQNSVLSALMAQQGQPRR